MRNLFVLICFFFVFGYSSFASPNENSASSNVASSQNPINDFDEFRRNANEKFEQYKQKSNQEFEDYRKRINAEFAEYMSQKWVRHELQSALEPTPLPEPPAPVVKDDEDASSSYRIPADEILPALVPEPVEPPQPAVPIPTPAEPVKPSFSFNFYGRRCDMPFESKHRFMLADPNEKSVADAWRRMSNSSYDPLISACLDLRSQLNLCDWGYLKLLEDMTTAFFPSSQLNEARLLQMYLLTQSGYKVRMCRVDGRLVLLLPSEDNIFNYTYVTKDREKYYLLDKSISPHSNIYIFDAKYPGERTMSLAINSMPDLPLSATSKRTLQSKHCTEATVDVSGNRNLIKFLDDYPRHDNWNNFVRTSMSPYVKTQLYPVLRNAIQGKEQRMAANILLQWVQTAFEYQTDEQQFGAERTLYADETLFYPFCDCEDRAILYAVLVKELIGLDAVLLYYPGHIAAAVAFTDNVSGDYVEVDGRRFVVCDPTYINSSVGDAMPQFRGCGVSVMHI